MQPSNSLESLKICLVCHDVETPEYDEVIMAFMDELDSFLESQTKLKELDIRDLGEVLYCCFPADTKFPLKKINLRNEREKKWIVLKNFSQTLEEVAVTEVQEQTLSFLINECPKLKTLDLCEAFKGVKDLKLKPNYSVKVLKLSIRDITGMFAEETLLQLFLNLRNIEKLCFVCLQESIHDKLSEKMWKTIATEMEQLKTIHIESEFPNEAFPNFIFPSSSKNFILTFRTSVALCSRKLQNRTYWLVASSLSKVENLKINFHCDSAWNFLRFFWIKLTNLKSLKIYVHRDSDHRYSVRTPIASLIKLLKTNPNLKNVVIPKVPINEEEQEALDEFIKNGLIFRQDAPIFDDHDTKIMV